jgi:hypothetical protein
MANPFSVNVPNAFEALMVGEQGYRGAQDQMRQRARDDAMREAAAALQSGGDVKGAFARVLASGNVPAAGVIANYGNNERDFQFRQSQAAESNRRSDRSFDFQKQQAEEAARGYELREVTDDNGNRSLVRIHRATGRPEKVEVPGMTGAPNNPYLPAGQMNESQSKDALYANRMLASEKVLRTVEESGTSWVERAKGAISDKTGYNLRGDDFQKFDQAKRDFINATLRRESGAVISPSEFDNADKQYFPVPGDTKELLAQKRANRAEAIRGIGAGGGKGYRPESVISQTGEITLNPSGARKPAPPEIIAEAKEAIATAASRGEDIRAAVAKRLVEQGYNPAGL